MWTECAEEPQWQQRRRTRAVHTLGSGSVVPGPLTAWGREVFQGLAVTCKGILKT